MADDVLITDEITKRLELGPGDQLFTFGFPRGLEVNEMGFALLRGGFISSYPLTPLADTKKLTFDFNNVPGNSGGPVFYYNSTGARRQGGNLVMEVQPEIRIVGLVSGVFNENATEPVLINGAPAGLAQQKSLGLALVPNASAIRATIDKLPPS